MANSSTEANPDRKVWKLARDLQARGHRHDAGDRICPRVPDLERPAEIVQRGGTRPVGTAESGRGQLEGTRTEFASFVFRSTRKRHLSSTRFSATTSTSADGRNALQRTSSKEAATGFLDVFQHCICSHRHSSISTAPSCVKASELHAITLANPEYELRASVGSPARMRTPSAGSPISRMKTVGAASASPMQPGSATVRGASPPVAQDAKSDRSRKALALSADLRGREMLTQLRFDALRIISILI